MFWPALKKAGVGGAVGSAGGGPPARRPAAPCPPLTQTPLKSGLPSGVRGVGAVRSGFPSEFFGVPGGVYRGHCAKRGTVNASAAATTQTNMVNHFIRPPPSAWVWANTIRRIQHPVQDSGTPAALMSGETRKLAFIFCLSLEESDAAHSSRHLWRRDRPVCLHVRPVPGCAAAGTITQPG